MDLNQGSVMHYRRLDSKDFQLVAKLFNTIKEDPSAKKFHPHPFTEEHAKYLAEYQGRDLYLGAFSEDELAGYGLLRGWDANFEIPSLGIYLIPAHRGKGIARQFMEQLHQFALQNGAAKVRLKVYPENLNAVHLYQRLGYVFSSEEDGQLVGLVDLHFNTKS